MKNIRITIVSILFVIAAYTVQHLEAQSIKSADLIIFSFNRPMQLYAVLESTHKYMTNLNKIFVLYRTTTQDYENGYQEIQRTFPDVQFVKQGSNPRADFKPLLLRCFYGSPAEYIMFSVDDDIVKDYVDIQQCIHALEKSGAYGFYLRLGTNITTEYDGRNTQIGISSYTEIEPNILKFNFKDGIGTWAYPHNLDMTIFKKSHIEHFYRNNHYTSPNTLESNWAGAADLNCYGLCFRTSKKFMLPLNIVQQDWWCPNENSFTAEQLQAKWNNGLCINIEQFFQDHNNCVLVGYMPLFIPRNTIIK